MRSAMLYGLTFLLVIAACDTPSVPASPSGDSSEFVRIDTRAVLPAGYVPLLDRLFRNTVSQVGETAGTLEIERILAAYRGLLQEAREASAAGDLATAATKRREADALAARTIVRVQGTAPIERTLLSVETRLGELRARIDGAERRGENVTSVRELVQTISRLSAAARSNLAGNPALALHQATQAFDLISTLYGS